MSILSQEAPRTKGPSPSPIRSALVRAFPRLFGPARRPVPIMALVAHMAIEGHDVTSIARVWKGPRDAARCRLCPDCKAARPPGSANVTCLVLIPDYVPRSEALHFEFPAREGW